MTTAEVHTTEQLELELNSRSFKEALDTTYIFASNVLGVKNNSKLCLQRYQRNFKFNTSEIARG